MNRKKVKHSKYKNTGLIFEFLLRQITSDILNDEKNNSAVRLIKKFFNERRLVFMNGLGEWHNNFIVGNKILT